MAARAVVKVEVVVARKAAVAVEEGEEVAAPVVLVLLVSGELSMCNNRCGRLAKYCKAA